MGHLILPKTGHLSVPLTAYGTNQPDVGDYPFRHVHIRDLIGTQWQEGLSIECLYQPSKLEDVAPDFWPIGSSFQYVEDVFPVCNQHRSLGSCGHPFHPVSP